MSVSFAKGHGTGNDFVILADDDGHLELSASTVRALTDRRRGIGGDGLLRVVPAALSGEPDVVAQAGVAQWFMDYRNADGSIAEMCGNGVRVFAHYLRLTGRVTETEFHVATRGGTKLVRVVGDGVYAVTMGGSHVIDSVTPISVRADGRHWPAVGVALPNPHAVAFVDSLADAGALDVMPEVAPAAAYPHGTNVEFVRVVGPAHIEMRVFERGVGETLSCGTGACAAAWASRRRAGGSAPSRWQVDVPGGTVFVDEDERGILTLSGPAVIVASGTLAEDLL